MLVSSDRPFCLMAFHLGKRSKASIHQRDVGGGGDRRLWSTLSGILRFERFETKKNRKTVEKVPGIQAKGKRFRRLTTTFCFSPYTRLLMR